MTFRGRIHDALLWQRQDVPNIVARLVEENNDLRVRLHAIMGPPIEALKLDLDQKDPEIRFRSHLVKMFLWEMAKILDGDPLAKNCIQLRIQEGRTDDGRAFAVTLQRIDGRTPMELRAETEAENVRLRTRIAELEAAHG
jgi:hypothetical protein